VRERSGNERKTKTEKFGEEVRVNNQEREANKNG
jgi:hypothetical protein